MSNSISVNQETDVLIKDELSKFVLKHTGQDALSAIDEIVLSYMVGILETLGSADSSKDEFDVDEFAEMMSAYIPSFSNINSSDICEWMFHLADWLKKSHDRKGVQMSSVEDTFFCLTRLVSSDASSENVLSSSPSSSASSSRSRSTSQSEDDEKNTNHNIQTVPTMNQELELLTEMFPDMSIMDITQYISMVNGDCEKAVQLILQRQDNGEQVVSSVVSRPLSKLNSKKGLEYTIGDKELREHILNKYGYIDQDDDVKEHKPVVPKPEPKKLIRYRDNKIVSVKGERFSEVKTEEDDTQKKTYIALKPARQYRFH